MGLYVPECNPILGGGGGGVSQLFANFICLGI